MKFSVFPAPGLGDFLILHIVSYHLKCLGHEVSTITPHRFGKWLAGYQFDPLPSDAIFLQYDNSSLSKELRGGKNVYTFFGSYSPSKHGPLKQGYDFVADPNQTMVQNIQACLQELFAIEASTHNGLTPPEGCIYRKYPHRVVIHATSGNPFRNFPKKKFDHFARWAQKEGLEPFFLPHFNTLEELSTCIYESGYFVGNDSGPAHLASYLRIPHLVIGRCERHMRHWKPGWKEGTVLTPSRWIPNFKGPLRLRERHWEKFISSRKVIKSFKNKVIQNI